MKTLLAALHCYIIWEQLQVPKHGRQYSIELITSCFLWQLTSFAIFLKSA